MHRHHGVDFASPEECAFCALLRKIVELDEENRKLRAELEIAKVDGDSRDPNKDAASMEVRR